MQLRKQQVKNVNNLKNCLYHVMLPAFSSCRGLVGKLDSWNEGARTGGGSLRDFEIVHNMWAQPIPNLSIWNDAVSASVQKNSQRFFLPQSDTGCTLDDLDDLWTLIGNGFIWAKGKRLITDETKR